MKTQILKPPIVLAATLLAQPSDASTISYELQDLGANNYRYVYTIGNDGTLPGSSAIQLFDILFDPSQYLETSLNISSASSISSEWSEQFLASAPNIPAAYDTLANGSGIAVGTQTSGFAVDFIWLGSGLPESQIFEIYDPDSFTLLESGNTQPLNTVPLPATLTLFLTALIGLFAFGKSYRLK